MLKAPIYDLFITQEYDLTITEQAIRVIKDRILEEKMSNKSTSKHSLDTLCKHISEMEKKAVEAERASIKFK